MCLYPDGEIGLLALGIIGFPKQAKLPTGDLTVGYSERITELRHLLEEWVDLYSREVKEFEGEFDLVRLRSEARAILLCLREVSRLFPEVFAMKADED